MCDGWNLVKRTDMSVIAERVPLGEREVRHFHSTAHQFMNESHKEVHFLVVSHLRTRGDRVEV